MPLKFIELESAPNNKVLVNADKILWIQVSDIDNNAATIYFNQTGKDPQYPKSLQVNESYESLKAKLLTL